MIRVSGLNRFTGLVRYTMLNNRHTPVKMLLQLPLTEHDQLIVRGNLGDRLKSGGLSVFDLAHHYRGLKSKSPDFAEKISTLFDEYVRESYADLSFADLARIPATTLTDIIIEKGARALADKLNASTSRHEDKYVTVTVSVNGKPTYVRVTDIICVGFSDPAVKAVLGGLGSWERGPADFLKSVFPFLNAVTIRTHGDNLEGPEPIVREAVISRETLASLFAGYWVDQAPFKLC